MPSRSKTNLTGGRVQFAIPAAFVPNLRSFKAKVRPSKYHWLNNKPPVLTSIPQLERVLYTIGGQGECEHLIEYDLTEPVKLCFDVEWAAVHRLSTADAFDIVVKDVIEPVNAFIFQKTGLHIDLQELVVEEACRQRPVDFKFSFHVVWPSIAIRANLISALIEHLHLPAICDKAPWTGGCFYEIRSRQLCSAFLFVYLQVSQRQQLLHSNLYAYKTYLCDRIHLLTLYFLLQAPGDACSG